LWSSPLKGETRVLAANAQAITDAKGNNGAVLVMHDIRQRKRVEKRCTTRCATRGASCGMPKSWSARTSEGQTAAYHWGNAHRDEEAAQHVLPLVPGRR
jgi:hypothetical protein